jgi:integrase
MAPSTVYTYLQALSVYQRSGAKTNPVRAYFAEHRPRRTKASAASVEMTVLAPGAGEKLLRAAERHPDPQAIGLVLHGIDAGLRLGEIRARAWAHHAWGSSADDRTRALIVAENIPSGGEGAELPKTGKVRRVHMSRRLREWLLDERNRQGTGAAGRVFHDRGARGFRGLLARLSSRAGIDPANFLTLRHTFASELISAGFPVEFVARQLGNTPAVCRTHYLRWLTDDYAEPPRLEPGELPCDWLARVTGHAGTSRGTSEQKAE